MKALVFFLSIAGAIFFLVRGFQLRAGLKNLSQLETKRAELDEARAKENKQPVRVRLRRKLVAAGYDGDVFPFAAAVAFLYLAAVVGLHILGLGTLLAAVVALPASAALLWWIAMWTNTSRRRRFNTQLIDMLDAVAGQITAGTGAQKALSTVVPNMQEPLRGEMSKVLDAQLATKDLIGSIRVLRDKYPSRAFNLFIAALEIDQADGQAIAPALQQAAELLKADQRLMAEASAELSQQRGEFFLILGILAGIAAFLVLGHDPQRQAAYTSPMGIAVLSLAVGNVAFGIYRLMRILRKIRGEES
jgi:Flp pilus assembly protein TadB